MSLDEPQSMDHVQVINQIQVAIDRDIEEYIGNVVLEFDPKRGRFLFVGNGSC